MRVLIVEDNPDDADLLLRELRRGGLEIVHERVETEAAMNAALDAHSWDLVIADFALPQFSGLAALALVQRRGMDLPFILVSGNVGEETAVAAMKAGASDYLMKGNLARLVPAVQRELRDAEVRREARRTEQNLHEREAQLAEAQRLAHVGSWHWNARTGVAIWSEEVYRICDRDSQLEAPTTDEFLGCVHPDDRSLVTAPLQSADRQFAHDLRIVRSDGSVHFVHVRGEITRDDRGEPLEAVGTIQDITERKLAEQELRAARDALEARVSARTAELSDANARLREQQLKLESARQAAELANQSKSDFLANMSHEIRTPMTAILGYADMLLSPARSASDRLEYIHTIRRQSEHLLSILNDILDLSKIEAGKLDIEAIQCDPSHVIGEAISLMRVRAIEKNLGLTVVFAGPIPETIRTDPNRLRQILINLIGNAVKFTEKGGVQVLVSLEHRSESSSPKLRLEIVDSGLGISPAEITSLFQPFKQLDNSATRRFGGTGLGLSICKRLSQALGGDISADSRPGCGSRFTFTIDTGSLDGVRLLYKSHEAVMGTSPDGRASEVIESRQTLAGRVLLAEDGIHNQRVISYYLKEAGADVEVADNGRIACQKVFDAISAARPFDVILMDMQMPEMDGYSAAANLRNKGYKGPIIALTAHAMAGDRAKCLGAGCTDYLTKPIEKVRLINAVAACLAGRAESASLNSPDENRPPGTSASRSLCVPPGDLVPQDVAQDPVVAHLLPGFVADLPSQVDRLLSRARDRDIAELGQALHQLKGCAGVYGFPDVTQKAAQAENHLASVGLTEAVMSDIQALIKLIRDVQGYDRSKEACSSGGKEQWGASL